MKLFRCTSFAVFSLPVIFGGAASADPGPSPIIGGPVSKLLNSASDIKLNYVHLTGYDIQVTVTNVSKHIVYGVSVTNADNAIRYIPALPPGGTVMWTDRSGSNRIFVRDNNGSRVLQSINI